MFRQMKRKQQELSRKKCIEILEKQSRGFLGVLGDNEYPYSIPMNYVFHENKIFFHSAREGL